MITRRILLASAAAALPSIAKQNPANKFGLEIYSLRREAEKDLPATLAMIRKFGFRELEVAGFTAAPQPNFNECCGRTACGRHP